MLYKQLWKTLHGARLLLSLRVGMQYVELSAKCQLYCHKIEVKRLMKDIEGYSV